MAVTDAQFLDHANQNNGEFANRRIVIKGSAAPTGSTIAPKYAIYIRTTDDQEYRNEGTFASPIWVAFPDLSGKEDVGQAQSDLRDGVATAGDTLKKLYNLILSLGTGLSVPVAFDANAASLFPTGVSGDAYIVNVAGTVDGQSLNIGDLFWTDTSTTSQAGSYVDWYIVPTAGTATETVAGLVELATQAEAEATSSQSNTVVLTVLRGWQQLEAWWSNLKTTTGKDLSEVNFTSTLNTKLSGIEANATADQTDSEIETAYNNQVAIVSQANAEAGTSTTAYRWTPQRVAQAIAALKSSEEVTRFDWTISGHSFSAGDPIAFNDNTNVFVLSVSNDTDLQHLGFVTAVNGDVVTISLNGLIDITGWGLTQYTRYYLHTDGSLITTDNGFPIIQTISSTKGVIIARGSGTGSAAPTAISQGYTKEVDMDGSTNQVTLDHAADTIIGVFIDGHLQDDDQWSSAVPVDVTVITLEDTAATLSGKAVKVIYIQNAVLGGDITVYWDDILSKPFPDQTGKDDTYYVYPVGDGTFGYKLATSQINPTLQNVTDNGTTTTNNIVVAGLNISNFSTRSLLYVDTDGSVNMATLGTGLALSAGGELSGSFLPLTGGVVTGNSEFQGLFQLTGISVANVSSHKPVFINPTTGYLYYREGVNLDYVTTQGNSTSNSISVSDVTISSLVSSGTQLVYVDANGKFQPLKIGTNLSLDLVNTYWTLNATGGTGGTVISGTTNKMAKFNSVGNNVIDSQIMDDGTSVGIFVSSPSTSSLLIAKSHTTSTATIQQLGSSGDVLQLRLPTGGNSSQNFIKGIYSASTVRFRVDINGKAYFKNLNLTLGVASTMPLLITSSGDVTYGAVDYNSSQIINKPTIPAAQVNSDWNAVSGIAQILNKPTLATVATTGSYNDLSNKPTIPAAQVNSDWNAGSGVAQILNKPTLATVATTGSWLSLTNTPSSFSGQSLKAVVVNIGETALAFQSLASVATGGTLLNLTDTPGSYSGHGTHVLKINSGATAVEFAEFQFTDSADTPNSYSGNAYKLLRVNSAETAVEFYDMPVLTKMVNIGDWNMNSLSNVNVAHGITLGKIRAVRGMVRSDDDTIYIAIGMDGSSGGDIQVYTNTINSSFINVTRRTAGVCTGTNWDTASSYNRGWLIIEYTN